jgi:hypothetical protein
MTQFQFLDLLIRSNVIGEIATTRGNKAKLLTALFRHLVLYDTVYFLEFMLLSRRLLMMMRAVRKVPISIANEREIIDGIAVLR